MVGVGLLRAFGDFDQAGKDRACIVEQCIFIEQVGHGVAGVVRLESALVEFLRIFGYGERVHFHVCARTLDTCLILKTRTFSADVDGDVLDQCVALGDCGVELEGDGFLIPILHDLAEDLGAAGCVDVRHRDVQGLVRCRFGEEDVDHGGIRISLCNN